MKRFDNRRFSLPVPVRPGATARFSVPVYFSLDPGAYRLEWDLVREGEFWGRDRGWKTAAVELNLLPLVTAGFRSAWLPTFYESGRDWLDREQYLLRQVLRNNEMRFKGKLFAFAAGTTYPQAWIRDTATMMGYARYFYPLSDLQGIVDRFFMTQSPTRRDPGLGRHGRALRQEHGGERPGNVAGPGRLASGPERSRLAGRKNCRRLAACSGWTWPWNGCGANRRDPARGLIWSGFTADWGDVERSYADGRAIKLSDRSRRTFSTYTQALFIQAAQKLALMAERLGDRQNGRPSGGNGK